MACESIFAFPLNIIIYYDYIKTSFIMDKIRNYLFRKLTNLKILLLNLYSLEIIIFFFFVSNTSSVTLEIFGFSLIKGQNLLRSISKHNILNFRYCLLRLKCKIIDPRTFRKDNENKSDLISYGFV